MCDTLVQVHVFFRHGNRTPVEEHQFPNNPYNSEKYKPYGKSNLTLEGKKNSFRLGKLLKKIYGNFLGQDYDPELLNANSTDTTRCIMTLQLVLAGMFPPTKDWMIHEELNWQPININILPVEKKILTYDRKLLYTYLDQIEDAGSDELLEKIKKYSGFEKVTFKDFYIVTGTIHDQKIMGLPEPEWAKYFTEDIRRIRHKFWNEVIIQKYYEITGNALQKVLYDSEDKISNVKETPKIFLYSCHDLNIVPILAYLGNYHNQQINFNSMISFELHNINGTYGYKILAFNFDSQEPTYLDIPEIGTFCSLEKMLELISNPIFKTNNS